MNLRTFLSTLLTITFLATNTLSSEFLEPEDSIFSKPFDDSEYHKNVITVLKDAYGPDVVARAITIPSFQFEFAVALRLEDENFTILHLQPNFHIWSIELLKLYKEGKIISRDIDGNDTTQDRIQELETAAPNSLDKIDVERCELRISTELGSTLLKVWRKMLHETRYRQDRTLGLDGTTYHFSAKDNYQTLAGKIWSPDKESKSGKLVQIVHGMRDICLGNERDKLSDLSIKVEALLSEF